MRHETTACPSERIGPPAGSALADHQILALLDSLDRGLLVVDRGGDLVLANPAAMSLLGHDSASPDLLLDGPGREVAVLLAQCLRLRVPVTRQITTQRCSIAAEAALLPGSEGAMAYAVLRDTSPESQTEDRCRAAAADIAHDLRAPACAIQCRVEDLLQSDSMPPDEQRSHLNAILDECRRIALLAGDILDVSALFSGHVRLTLDSCDLSAVAASCMVTLSNAAERSGVALVNDLGERTSLVLGDSVRVQQALMNLLSNALSHTPGGGSVRVWSEQAGDFVRLCVTDTGCGICGQDIERIWERFIRASGAEPGRQGTGLGLTIVKKIALLHGGDVGASSAPGEGSTFWLTLPRFPSRP